MLIFSWIIIIIVFGRVSSFVTITGVVSYKHMEEAWMIMSGAESNPDDEPVTILRSARLATKEKNYNDSSSEDTGDQVKEKKRGQCRKKAKHNMKKKGKSAKERAH